MKFLREEVMELKRNKGNVLSPTESSISRSERRIGRMLRAIEKGEDTSVVDDSEAMEIEHLPTFDWFTTKDSHVFRKPLPVGLNGSKSMGPGPNGRSPHPGYLQQKEDKLVQLALEESLKDIRDARDKAKKYEQIGKEEGKDKQDQMESPKPQRSPRVIRPKKSQGD